MEKVAIIGFGKLGSHLYHALKRTGRYSISVVVKSSRHKPNKRDIENCNIIFITVNDSKIQEAAKEISRLSVDFRNKYVFHASGALSSEILSSLKKKRASVGSFHPVQTFEHVARKHHTKFRNIYIAVEGDYEAVSKAFRVARHLSSIPFQISSSDKILHHINCVIASNYLVGHLNYLDEISNVISSTYRAKRGLNYGFKKHKFFDIYKPLIEQTLENIRTKGIKASLTGPIERNDTQTIKLHIKKLKNKLPEILNFYSQMGIETVRLAVKNKNLGVKDGRSMIELFKKTISLPAAAGNNIGP
jgi:predicted short-subunit dehydrogenase-like oxidoreductase (DUF2520 family)